MTDRIPSVIRIQVENTPAASDPVGAHGYYEMLGMTMMALGRLEGHFNVCLLIIMNLPGAEELGFMLYISWKKRAKMWRKGFEAAPSLQYHKDGALALLTEIVDVMQDRHALAHAIWENFVPGQELGVAALNLKHKNGTTDGLEHRRDTITMSMLTKILRKANILNRELLQLSQFLCTLRPAPPEARKL
jgi:hypothetical protein